MYNNGLYALYDELHIVKVTERRRLKWLGHLCRKQEVASCRKLTLPKLEGTQRVGSPKLRWLESVEEDFKHMGVRNWGLE
jgi:ribosomal 50S subunit-associated protein YjgA (DUF615 family)